MKYQKAITFSYDDGIESDRKLVEILNRYGSVDFINYHIFQKHGGGFVSSHRV